MSQDPQESRQELLPRVGLVLFFFIFTIGAIVAFSSGASGYIVFALSVCAAFMLWSSIFAYQWVAKKVYCVLLIIFG
jgi:hypothetical protein